MDSSREALMECGPHVDRVQFVKSQDPASTNCGTATALSGSVVEILHIKLSFNWIQELVAEEINDNMFFSI